MIIRSRLIDCLHKEARHQDKISLDEEFDDDGNTLMDTVADKKDYYEESSNLEATKEEYIPCTIVIDGESFSNVARVLRVIIHAD